MSLSWVWFLFPHGRVCVPVRKSELMLSLLQAFQIINSLDLVTLTIAIWTLWTAFSLPAGGALKRAFRLIAFGALAFALSHIVDALVAELHLLSTQTGILCHQAGVLVATTLFVVGIGRLAGALPTLATGQRESSFSVHWSLTIGLLIFVAAISFILYGLSLEVAVAAFIGIDGCLLFMIGLCCALLRRAQIGGVIGRSLWLAFVGLLCFALAHPLQAWTLFAHSSAPAENAILHRLIVVPAFLLFSFSLTTLARTISRTSIRERMASQEEQGRALAQAPSPSPARSGKAHGARPRVQPQPLRRPSPAGWRSTSGFHPSQAGQRWPG